MPSMKAVTEGGKVVTRAQLNRVISTYSEKVAAAVKLIEDRQIAFEEEVRLALLAIEDEAKGAVSKALEAERERTLYRRVLRRIQRFPL
jgi:hypothetical protein